MAYFWLHFGFTVFVLVHVIQLHVCADNSENKDKEDADGVSKVVSGLIAPEISAAVDSLQKIKVNKTMCTLSYIVKRLIIYLNR